VVREADADRARLLILQRLAAMADQDPSLRDRQPWKAAHDNDYRWLGDVITKHYHGDDSDVKVLMGGILQAFAGMTVDDYGAAAHRFLVQRRHPTLGRRFHECGYRPMIDLLGYLAANGFTCYIASGGDRDFMRPVTQAIYSIPSERVIGSSTALRYEPDEHGGQVVYLAEPDYFDDGPIKPVRIWSRVGRRPILAAGNSNGDLPMLRFAGGPARPGLRLLVLHDDPERVRLRRRGRAGPPGGRGARLDGGQRQARLGHRVRPRQLTARARRVVPRRPVAPNSSSGIGYHPFTDHSTMMA
jgi:haloacid dehalogenase-like hydrolase